VYVGFARNLPVFQSWVDCSEGGEEEAVKFPGSGSCWLLPSLWAAHSMRWIL
jgi:hypothetical protein